MPMNRGYEKKYFQALPFKIIFPVILTVVLFVTTLFFLLLPRMETNMMALKRETIRELTESAWSALLAFERDAESGIMTQGEARRRAVDHLRQLRYGPESKDYYWINDMHPRLIMHPYRPDLEGEDITNYTDPDGKRLFVEFVEVVKDRGSGYVDYEWQWKDDPNRTVPKISYVKGFEPWGWIIGTGIYIEDVRAEIAALTRNIVFIILGIMILLSALSGYIIWQGVKRENERLQAESRSRLHQEQLFQAAKMASLGTLVSGVAHEINNPIMSVMLNGPILRKAWASAIPILDEYCRREGDFHVHNMNYSMLRDRIPMLLNHIEEGAVRIKTIVSDLKDFARQQPPDLSEAVDINRIARKAVSLVNNLIQKSTADFSADYQPDLPILKGSSQRIEQVVINLLVNACQSLPDNTRAIRLSTRHDMEGQRVILEIRDRGIGMSEALLRRIRDPFFTTKREIGGTGLGLSISERIIEAHGGEMTFTSAPHQGTTVRIFFPVNSIHPPQPGDEPKGTAND
jgi:signal transduction histidine kinase